jgi:Lactonase, 7-bladed beta-propeller/Chaperone of endosialidase
MKQLLSLFLFLVPCIAWAQYPTNGNQKITLGEQTTADGLVYRGVIGDTALITPLSDTSAYIILDTANNRFYNYNRATNVWSIAGGSDTSLIAYMNTYATQTVNGIKTFNNRLISTNAMHFVDTSLSIVSFAKRTVQPSGIVGAGSGALSSKTGYSTGTNPISVNVDPTGRFVYVANYISFTVSMYVINQTNGTLSTKTDYSTGANPYSVNVDPTGRFVYVANYGSANVSMYVINQTNGTLSTKTDYSTGTNPASVNVDPTGRFVYVANYGNTTVSQYFLQSFSAGGYNVTGSLGIGTSTPSEALHVVGNARITAMNGIAAIGADADGVLQAATSDMNLKNTIENSPFGLNEILLLNPVTFLYNDTNRKLDSDVKEVGFIAQDVFDIIPNSVSSTGTGDLQLDYRAITATLVKAIQEQNLLIKALEQRLLILENK